MKNINVNLLMDFIHSSTEEQLMFGDITLTWEINKDPILMVSAKESPLCFAFGWDSSENHSVFSLN